MNVRQPSDLLSLMEGADIPTMIDDDSIEIFDVDTEAISNESRSQAREVLENLTQLYSNYDFLKEHPQFKRRLDTELESLRIVLKMRMTSEKIHDKLAEAIGHSPDNASLYMAFTRIQKSLIDIQGKQDAAIDRINNIMHAYQLELDFQEERAAEAEDTDIISTDDADEVTARGAKSFIEQMSRIETSSDDVYEDDAMDEE